MQDYTEKSHKKGKLENEKLITILESIEEIIYVSDPETYELLYLNPAGIGEFGDRTGEKCYSVLQNRKKPCPFCTNHLIFAKDAELPHIWNFKNEVNGRWYKCTDTSIRWTNDRLVRFEIAVDITDRMLAEQALRASEERFRFFLNEIPAAAFLKDSAGRYIFTNQYMKDILGADESWIGRTTMECFPIKEAKSIIASDKDAFTNRYSIHVQKLIDSTGKERIFQTHKFRISGVENKKQMLGGIALDITDKIDAEKATEKLELQVLHAQKLESLGVLAGGIAHDFNNILMAILGYTNLALLDVSPSSPAKPSLLEIEKAAQDAADLAKQMLAYSGRGKFQIIKLDVNEIIKGMLHLFEISISKKAVIKYNLSNDLPAIEADPSQIRQIIMNLITNASDALEKTSGIISITTSLMDCDRKYLSTAYLNDELKEGKYVYIEVADTGSGMNDETLSKLFDPFFTTKFTGRGLGLSAVLGIVRGHRGTIKVYSEPGNGTSFKVLLPAVDGEPDSGKSNDDSKPEVFSGTILLVDDESSIREVGKAILERKGFSVLVACDGREALEIYRDRHDKIDCVILDLTMPHMDGEETFREMRRVRSNVRVIMSSGYNSQEVTRRFTGKGLAGFIQKPYRMEELLLKLKEILG